MPRSFVVGTFSEASRLLEAVRAARGVNLRIYDVYSPYPVHGMDEAMGIRRSRLPWVTLIVGFSALLFALLLQFYTAVMDWPINIGGKPDNSTLAFIPITFELTVLCGGLATVAALLLRTRLFPGKHECLAAAGVTDDTFALVLRKRDANFDTRLARAVLEQNGADRVEETEADL